MTTVQGMLSVEVFDKVLDAGQNSRYMNFRAPRVYKKDVIVRAWANPTISEGLIVNT